MKPPISATVSSSPLQRRFPVWLPGLVLCGMVNLVHMPLVMFFDEPMGPPELWAVACLAIVHGLMTAQPAVLAVWLVFSEWPLWLKLALHWLAALFLFGCWGVGAVAAPLTQQHVQLHSQALVFVACTLPPISLAVQLPLWLCRCAFGWRLLPKEASAAAFRGLSIRDLLMGTAVVAVSLGIFRAARLWPPKSMPSDYWLNCAVVGLVLITVSTVVILPLVMIILRPRAGETAATGAVVFSVAAIALAEILTLSHTIMLGELGAGGGDTLLVSGVYFAMTLASLATPLFIVRGQGYRLCFRCDVQRGLAGRAEPS